MVHHPETDTSAESKGTLNITIKDNNDDGVSGAKIKLENKSTHTEYESTSSGTLGGCKIENLPYGQYTAIISALPETYIASTIDDITIDQSNNTLTVTVTKDD